jgi:hypothetical protein
MLLLLLDVDGFCPIVEDMCMDGFYICMALHSCVYFVFEKKILGQMNMIICDLVRNSFHLRQTISLKVSIIYLHN